MQRLKLSAVLLLCFLFAVLAAKANACVCVMTMEGTHPCQLYRDASAVFLGQVINIGPMTLSIRARTDRRCTPCAM